MGNSFQRSGADCRVLDRGWQCFSSNHNRMLPLPALDDVPATKLHWDKIPMILRGRIRPHTQIRRAYLVHTAQLKDKFAKILGHRLGGANSLENRYSSC
jgi:hypothetical protein